MLPLIQIRKMGIREAEEVSSLINKYFPDANLTSTGIRNKLADGFHFFVATSNMEIVGFLEIRLREKSAFIVGIATEANLSNKGIGTALMEHAINFAGRKGKNKIFLVVKATNTRAINLYRRYG
ncbi:GNAT family N-acetyltransferase, partial [Candidatus Micrarchaeota archaeon]|nr:GNAT family N-acetyltransferase [Candidatus Micrarchaeota archaeon]